MKIPNFILDNNNMFIELSKLADQFPNDMEFGRAAREKIQHFRSGDGKTPSTMIEPKPTKVFSREECCFHYCPHPELCKENCLNDTTKD